MSNRLAVCRLPGGSMSRLESRDESADGADRHSSCRERVGLRTTKRRSFEKLLLLSVHTVDG